MRYFSKKIIFSILTLALFLNLPFAPILRAHAADDTQVFEKCLQKNGAIAVGVKGLQAAIEAAMAALAAAGAVSTSVAASTFMVPTTNSTLAAPTGIDTGTTVASAIWQDDVAPYLDEMGYITGQCALEQLTNNTVKWIQGGFHGSPSFAIKPKQIFLDIQTSVANQLSKQVIDAQVTDFIPGFSNNLTKSIQLSTRVDAHGKFSAKIKTTLPTYVDPPTFYQDFNKGGWGAFGASLQDNNNPFGVMIIVGDELAARQLEAETQQKQQLDWSHGFIDLVDTDRCTYPDYMYLDVDGQPDPEEYEPSEIATLQKEYCEITTPGNVISDQLSKTLDTDLDRLGFADDMNKIITALISSLVQTTVKHVF